MMATGICFILSKLQNLQFCWVRGRHARTFLKNAGETPAHPGVLQFPLLKKYMRPLNTCVRCPRPLTPHSPRGIY